jgi:hypothetical protein
MMSLVPLVILLPMLFRDAAVLVANDATDPATGAAVATGTAAALVGNAAPSNQILQFTHKM